MTEQNTQEVAKPTLGVADLVRIAQIIQLATSRGSWKADELSAVGQTYDKLMAFLEAAGAVINKDTDADTESDSADSQEN
jgi:hypothetical protein